MTSILDPDHRLFALARQGRRQPSALLAIAVVPLLIALLIVGQGMSRRALRQSLGVEWVADRIAEVIGFGLLFLGLWLCVRWWSGRPFRSLGFERGGVFPQLLGGTLAAAAMVAIIAAMVMIPGASLAPGTLQTAGLSALGAALLALLGTAGQSSAEEALFRGWLLQSLGSRYGPLIGVLMSSLVFSLAHGLNPGITPLAAVNLFLFAVFAAVWAVSRGSLWGACAWHAMYNWTTARLLGLPISGAGGVDGLLTSIRLAGSETVTGGAFGPEAGLPATAVFAIAIGIVALRSSISSAPRARAAPPSSSG